MTAAIAVQPNDTVGVPTEQPSLLRLDSNQDDGDNDLLLGPSLSDQISENGLEDSCPCMTDDSSECDDNGKQRSQQEPQQPQTTQQQDAKLQTYSHADLQALNLLDQPVWIFDIVRRGMWWANHAAVELWSAPDLPSLLKRDFASDMSEATANRLDDYLLKFSSKDEVVKDRWTFYPNGGKYGPKTVDCTFRGIMIEEGRLAMLSQGVYVNDQHQQRTEAEQQALRASEMLRHLPVAVCLTDLDGNVMEQNPEALAVFGSLDTSKEEGKKQSSSSSSSSSRDDYDSDSDDEDDDEGEEATNDSTFVKRFVDKDLGRRILKEATKTGDDNGKNVIRLEALQHTVHGPRWSAIQVRQTKDPVTSKPILLYSARDITAVIEAKRQATAADLAKMDLLADMAHAVRTPLQHVVGVVELISRQGQSNKCQAQQQEETRFTNLLQSAAQLLMNVIHDLMGNVGGGSNPSEYINNTVSKGANKPSNRILLEHTQIDVRQVVEGAISTITPLADVKNLSVNVQMTRNSTSSLMGDAKRLGQVLFEMLHNAVKYTSTGEITVKVRRHTKKSRSRRVHLRFEVADTGVGLNLEQQKQCMQVPSCSHDDAKSKDEVERGVGLVLCKSLVEAMGGTIGVESKPGRGSTFWFEIPFLRAATGTPGATKKLPPKQSKKCKKSDRSVGSNCSLSLDPVPDDGGLQILLVDENNAGRNVMTALLEQSGHGVTKADNGDAMLSAVAQGSYDVVLLETQLGTEEGTTALDAVHQIRKQGHSLESLPILALTAAVPRADYPELGLNDWLTKPILMKDIKTAMTNAICNVGTSSVTAGSMCTNESSLATGESTGLGINAVSAVPQKRASLLSCHSDFSDQLQAVMGSSDSYHSACKAKSLAKPAASRMVAKPKTDRPPRMLRRSVASMVSQCTA